MTDPDKTGLHPITRRDFILGSLGLSAAFREESLFNIPPSWETFERNVRSLSEALKKRNGTDVTGIALVKPTVSGKYVLRKGIVVFCDQNKNVWQAKMNSKGGLKREDVISGSGMKHRILTKEGEYEPRYDVGIDTIPKNPEIVGDNPLEVGCNWRPNSGFPTAADLNHPYNCEGYASFPVGKVPLFAWFRVPDDAEMTVFEEQVSGVNVRTFSFSSGSLNLSVPKDPNHGPHWFLSYLAQKSWLNPSVIHDGMQPVIFGGTGWYVNSSGYVADWYAPRKSWAEIQIVDAYKQHLPLAITP